MNGSTIKRSALNTVHRLLFTVHSKSRQRDFLAFDITDTLEVYSIYSKVISLFTTNSKGVETMKKYVLLSLMLALALLVGTVVLAAEAVSFEPVRAPSKGPDNAPVTIIEIADFM